MSAPDTLSPSSSQANLSAGAQANSGLSASSLRTTSTSLNVSSTIPVGSYKFIDRINAKIQAHQPFFSFEYFPPKTADGLTNLYMRFDRMGSLGPVRVSFDVSPVFSASNSLRSKVSRIGTLDASL